ncbi:TrmH family RNA methyltransferase [Candidatus Parcubacteria bacterium]|jgi:tRNA G18 (ribose-2'-O)-methylase SpoU|nr:MAG: TrmH family RNA methyltransferase [Candidatus Parcubacteria bacterium]
MKKITEVVGILFDIRSLHNVGSIFRTADGAGFSKLFLCGITPTPLDRMGNFLPEFKKTSLGAEENIVWEHNTSIVRVISKLKKQGFEIYAVEQSKSSISYTILGKKCKKNKCAIIVGNEVLGIPEKVLNQCNGVVEIPMMGKKESLNVSVAFGIVAYECRR